MALLPNRSDVTANAKTVGYSVNGYHTIPSVWGVSTTGGTNVSASANGTEIYLGNTAGDGATIETVQEYQFDSVQTVRRYWIFDTFTNYPKTDLFRVGVALNSSNESQGIYADLATEELSINGSKVPFDTSLPVGGFQTLGLGVKTDMASNETTIELRSETASQTETVSGSSIANNRAGVVAESNGNGEGIRLLYNAVSYDMGFEI